MKTKTIIKSNNTDFDRIKVQIQITTEADLAAFPQGVDRFQNDIVNKVHKILVEEGFDVADLVVK